MLEICLSSEYYEDKQRSDFIECVIALQEQTIRKQKSEIGNKKNNVVNFIYGRFIGINLNKTNMSVQTYLLVG